MSKRVSGRTVLFVEWVDASHDRGPRSIREMRKAPFLVRSTGFFVREENGMLTIALEHFPETGDFRDISDILVMNILKVVVLRR